MKRILLLPEMYGLPRELPNESRLRNHTKIGNFKKICKVVLVNCKKKKSFLKYLTVKLIFFFFLGFVCKILSDSLRKHIFVSNLIQDREYYAHGRF